MSKRARKDLERAVKAIEAWRKLPCHSRMDFHGVRAEQRMLELCLNFVDLHHRKIAAFMDGQL